MAYSIGLNSLKNVIAVATALATVTTCLVPKSAQALIRFSGSPNSGTAYWVYDIDTSVPDLDPNPNAGLFPGAIQNFKLVLCTDSYSDLALDTPCSGNYLVREVAFQVGDLISSPITESNRPQYEEYIGGGGVRYDASFTTTDPGFENPNNLSIFVAPPLASDLINSLSGLYSTFVSNSNLIGADMSEFAEVQFPAGGTVVLGVDFTAVDVPEPNATGGLLSAGAIGALLLLKRKKGFTNQTNQNPGLES